jgi:hypothetical protein
MAAKEISVKKYVVRLSGEERERLETLIRKGKSPARRVLKAPILLKADVSEAGKGWSDKRIIEALETSPSMVYRVRKQLVEEGFEAVLSRKPRAMPAVARIFRLRKARDEAAADRIGDERENVSRGVQSRNNLASFHAGSGRLLCRSESCVATDMHA